MLRSGLPSAMTRSSLGRYPSTAGSSPSSLFETSRTRSASSGASPLSSSFLRPALCACSSTSAGSGGSARPSSLLNESSRRASFAGCFGTVCDGSVGTARSAFSRASSSASAAHGDRSIDASLLCATSQLASVDGSGGSSRSSLCSTAIEERHSGRAGSVARRLCDARSWSRFGGSDPICRRSLCERSSSRSANSASKSTLPSALCRRSRICKEVHFLSARTAQRAVLRAEGLQQLKRRHLGGQRAELVVRDVDFRELLRREALERGRLVAAAPASDQVERDGRQRREPAVGEEEHAVGARAAERELDLLVLGGHRDLREAGVRHRQGDG